MLGKEKRFDFTVTTINIINNIIVIIIIIFINETSKQNKPYSFKDQSIYDEQQQWFLFIFLINVKKLKKKSRFIKPLILNLNY